MGVAAGTASACSKYLTTEDEFLEKLHQINEIET